MPITPLPTPPSRQDPTTFAARADAFLGALPAFAEQMNAATPGESAAALAQYLADAATLGKGATLVAVRDAGGFFSAADVEAVLQEIGVALAPIAAAAARTAALIGARTSPHANFAWFFSDFTVGGCGGPGQAYLLQDVEAVFRSKFSAGMTPGITYVDGALGNDTTGTGGITAPYATLDKAIRTASGVGEVWVMSPGNYTFTGYRYSDTNGDKPKMVLGKCAGINIIDTGDSLSGLTFASLSGAGMPHTYEATVTTDNHATRVLQISRLDNVGLPMPMPKRASISDLNDSGSGWFFNPGAKKLYIRRGTENINTIKSDFSAIYAAGGDNALLIYSATLFLGNLTLLKYPKALKATGQPIPQIWRKGCVIRYPDGAGESNAGGKCYSQDEVIYRPAADCYNQDTADSTLPWGVEINARTYFAGDTASFPVISGAQPTNPISTAPNKNDSSVHTGYKVRINGIYGGGFGPNIADTDGSYTLNLGVIADRNEATGASAYGWIVQGSSARSWLDGCACRGGNLGINSDSGAVVNHFNSAGPRVSSSGGSFAAYTPG